MPERVADVIRQRILGLWLAAKDRDEIARITGVAAGTVSNVISEHRRLLANYDIEELRELSMAMKNAGTTPHECAEAVVMLNSLARSNVNVDDLQSFVNNIYKACSALGLPEEKLVDAAGQLLALSENLQDISVEELPSHLAKLKEERDGLLQEIENLYDKKRATRAELEQELKNNDATMLDLQQFSAARQVLSGQMGAGFSIVQDLTKLAKMFENARELGYNASGMAAKVSAIDSLQKQESALRASVEKREKQEKHLARECQRLQLKADSYQETIRFYQELREMGFGRSELDLLHSTLQGLVNDNLGSIMAVDESSGQAAVKMFFNDLKEMYAQHLTYKEQLSKLKTETEIQKDLLRDAERRYADKRDVIDAINTLRDEKGFSYEDVIYLRRIIFKHNIGRKGGKKFAQDLDRYGSMEEAIAACSSELPELKEEITRQTEKAAKLTEIVDDLEYKKDAITENLHTNAELAQAVLFASRKEGERSIAELTAKAQEGIQVCRDLLQEAKEISQFSAATIAKMNTEVLKQFEALSKLEGYKDLAEVASQITSTEEAKKVLQHPQKGIDLLTNTARVLRLLISIYEQIGPDGAELVRALEGVRSGIVTYVAIYASSSTLANATRQEQMEEEQRRQTTDTNQQ